MHVGNKIHYVGQLQRPNETTLSKVSLGAVFLGYKIQVWWKHYADFLIFECLISGRRILTNHFKLEDQEIET